MQVTEAECAASKLQATQGFGDIQILLLLEVLQFLLWLIGITNQIYR